MVQFADSPHNAAMRRHEQALGQAKASDPEARAARRKSIEDELVEEGQASIDRYRATLDARWERADCLAEYDGINMGYAIANRAQKRLNELKATTTDKEC